LPGAPTKTLIPIDGSPFTQRILDYVATHRDLLGAAPEVTLLTVVPTLPSRAAQFLAPELVSDYYVELGEKVLAPAIATLGAAGLGVTPLRRTGHAAHVIAEVASAGGFELLIMGSHGHSALAGLVLGSVVSGTLARCKTPVLVVR